MELYEVLKFKANVYEGQQKDKNDEPVILQLHQVSAEFKPIHPLVDKQEVLLKLFGNKIPVIENRHNIKDTGVLANIMQTDVHFDRLEHNSKKYLQALDDTTMRLLDDVMKFDPERILYANM